MPESAFLFHLLRSTEEEFEYVIAMKTSDE